MTKQEIERKIDLLKREVQIYEENLKKEIAKEKCEHDWDEPKMVKNRYVDSGVGDSLIFVMSLFDSNVAFQRKCKKCGKVETTSKYEIKYEPKWGK